MQGKRLSALDIAALLVALCSAVSYFSFLTADPDLWGHIKFGEDLWQHRALPLTDPYSFTAHGGRWVNHEWLAELIFYLTYRYLGDAGLLLGKLAIGLCVVLLMERLCVYRERHAVVFAGVMVLAVIVMSPGFMIRPQLFSFLFFTLFLYLFHLFFAQGKNRLFLLPLLMVFWVNLHGGFLMGWVLFAAATGWTTFSHFVLIRREKIGGLWFWFLLTSAAMLVNPYGYELLAFFVKTLTIPRQIGEWRPVSLTDLSYPQLKLMALLFLLALFFRPVHRQGWEVVCIFLTLYAGFRHERHMPFFAVAAAPYLVSQLSTSIKALLKMVQSLSLTVFAQNLLAFFFICMAAYQAYDGGRRYLSGGCRIIVDPRTYPVAALRFMKANDVQGNLLLPFDWGEYAIWKLYPNCRVSIDGRFRTVYPESVIRDHFIAEGDWNGWRALIEKYDSDILLARQIPFFQSLIKSDGLWKYVYSDREAILFLKNNGRNAEVLRRFRAGTLVYSNIPTTVYFPG